MKLSSLAAYVQALGGKLELRATFPDGSSVPLKHASAAITKRPKGSRAVKAIGPEAP